MSEGSETQRGLVTLSKATELRRNAAWIRILALAMPYNKATLLLIPQSSGTCDLVRAIFQLKLQQ